MRFSEFIGNEAVVGAVRQAIERRRVANAYLFSGPQAMGKRRLALTCAMSLLCQRFDGEPCGECPSCRSVDQAIRAQGFHPDLHILEPDGKFIKVDQVRDGLIAATQMQPREGAWQVFIVDPAEAMHPSAANAFLKTLEEAPGSSVFFLVSVNPVSLPATIRSRCQCYSFQPMAVDELARWLQQERGLRREEAEMVASLARGAPGTALSFDAERHRGERELALTVVRLALGLSSVEETFKVGSLLQKENEFFGDRLELVLTLLRDITLLSSAGATAEIVNIDKRDELLELARGRSPRRLAALITEVAKMREPLVRNVRADTVSESLILTGRRAFRSPRPA
jgi:DNA polymerase-3 subunit delta'